MMRPVLLTLLAAAVAAACSTSAAEPTATATEIPATSTATPPPVVPAVPTVVPTVTVGPPATPFMALTVTTAVDNVLLRENPGYLFRQLAVLKQGTPLLVMGRSPGGEWLFCQTPDHRAGWVFAQLIAAGSADVQAAPVIWPASAEVVVGMIRDRAGVPISGIQFSLIQGSGINSPRNDAMTDASGQFYAFMPADASGTWTVSYTAVSCKSNTMDASCNCIGGKCGMPDPLSTDIALPRVSGDTLQFTWR
jgi:hypothetical protein